MKKLTVSIIAALLVSISAFAQVDGPINIGAKEKKNAFFMGPKAGVTMTSMTQPDEGTLYDGFGIGFSGGLAMKARFDKATEGTEKGGTGYFGVALELKYKQCNVKTFGTDEKGKENAQLSLGFFEMPVSFQVYPFAKSAAMNTFYVELGAAFAGAMTRSPKSLTLNKTTTYVFDGDKKLKGYDLRPLAGIGYTIPNTGLDINARYYIGTSELAGNFPCKMNTIEVSLAWMFNVCGF
mgnify:CR=1 FL=1